MSNYVLTQSEFVISRYPNELIYVGIGPEIGSQNLHRLLPFETEDISPTTFFLGDEQGVDSISITVFARIRQDTISIVIMTTNDSTLLASFSFKKVGIPENSYILNLQNPPDSSLITADANSTINDEIKWSSIISYMVILQADRHEKGMRILSTCYTCINHDLICSPERVNRIKVWTVCNGWLWVDLTDCCYNHDINYWCASCVEQKRDADRNVGGCFTDKIRTAIKKRVSGSCWWWWGSIIRAQASSIGGIVSAVLYWVNPYEGRIGMGYNANSCLCPGGTVRTKWCDHNETLCEGTDPEVLITRAGNNCLAPFDDTIIIIPPIVDATYTATTWGGVSVTNQTSNYFYIHVTASGGITITINAPCGIFTMVKNINVGAAATPKVFFKTRFCYPTFPITTVQANSDGAYSYEWTVTGGVSIVSNNCSSIVLQASGANLDYCINVRGLGSCGNSSFRQFCGNSGDCAGEYTLDWGESNRKITTQNSSILNDINIYPNPANNIVSIELPQSSSYHYCTIHNLIGSKVLNEVYFSKDTKHIELDMSNYTSGSYIFTFVDESNKKKTEIVKILR